jgi:hypothetical protein
MAELGKLLALVARANHSFITAHGRATSRQNEGVRETVLRFLGRPWETEGPWEFEASETARFWTEWPTRLRIDREDAYPSVGIDGDRWWALLGLPGQGSTELKHGPYLGVAPSLLDPAEILSGFDLHASRAETINGHPCVLATGIPKRTLRPHHYPNPALAAWHADHCEFAFDEVRGVLIRATSYLDDEPVQIAELAEVEFDSALPTGIFNPPEGEVMWGSRKHREAN